MKLREKFLTGALILSLAGAGVSGYKLIQCNKIEDSYKTEGVRRVLNLEGILHSGWLEKFCEDPIAKGAVKTYIEVAQILVKESRRYENLAREYDRLLSDERIKEEWELYKKTRECGRPQGILYVLCMPVIGLTGGWAITRYLERRKKNKKPNSS